jgi:hypothetical protein
MSRPCFDILTCFWFIVRTIEQRVKYFTKFLGSRFTEKRKRSYINGFYYGLCAQLNKDRETLKIANQQLGMVLADQASRREKFVSDNVGPTKVVIRKKDKREHKGFLSQGFLDGKKLNIHTGCNSGSQNTPTLQLRGRELGEVGLCDNPCGYESKGE